MLKKYFSLGISLLFVIALIAHKGPSYDFVIDNSSFVQDTIPLEDRYNDFLQNQNANPFDLNDPKVINKTIDYDPDSDSYFINEKIGEEYYRMPSSMSFDDYIEYRAKSDEKAYFDKLSGVKSSSGEDYGLLDPVKKIDVEDNIVDKLFGGTDITIKPSGNIDVKFGLSYRNQKNPQLSERNQKRYQPLFDQDIQMSVSGKIGEKLSLSTNYSSSQVFDANNQMKLAYDGFKYGEDDIIKTIEAGNVTLPLRSSLIQGSESLFGIKTQLQFGHFWLTAIASQQKTQQKEIIIEGGEQVKTFEVYADDYDENRHFFLSHFNREEFEKSLSELPTVKSLFQINKVEVWITNERNQTENTREIVALADLGEYDKIVNTNPLFQQPNGPKNLDITGTNELPDNTSNGMLKELQKNDNNRLITSAVNVLQNTYGLKQGRDFEKYRARKLSPNEYQVHPQLGFVSINSNVRPEQVLGISYEYTYNGEKFQVGELSGDIPQVSSGTDSLPNVLFTKLLKSSTPAVGYPMWDLMMKNIYSIGAYSVSEDGFKLDIYYEDAGAGEKRFLPRTNLKGKPLLSIFNLDNLNRLGDPHPDGVFDFVPGLTIYPRNGRIMFPVLEPFGKNLVEKITDPEAAKEFNYFHLYEKTLTQAREYPEFNRFAIRGKYNNSSINSEIRLGAFKLPKGSVRVYAGGQSLVEGEQFTMNYNTGTITIIDESILNAGGQVRITFEDSSLFGFNQKTMIGLRGEYKFSDDFSIGSTFMHLFEKPYSNKVNIGNDPISNKIVGLDMSIEKKAPWLTKLVDKIPLIDTKEASSISFLAEGAMLLPGHAKAINIVDEKGGSVFLDDFEGSATGFDLSLPATSWSLASIPQNDADGNNPKFPESTLLNDTKANVNRALLSWYRPDIGAAIRDTSASGENAYSANIGLGEVFPNHNVNPTQQSNVYSLMMSYYPNERGQYNFEDPNGTAYSDGMTVQGELLNPKSRWGGIMRAINNTDFESSNYEYIEFWLLSPFIENGYESKIAPSGGELYFNLGNISEDILRDSRQFYENGLPGGADNKRPTDKTKLGRVPRIVPQNNSFSNENEQRTAQDVGLDGLNDSAERTFFKKELNKYENFLVSNVYDRIKNDPCNDNFVHYNDEVNQNKSVPQKYKRYANPEGNSRTTTSSSTVSATNYPDSEDVNKDQNFNELESYYEYKITLKNDGQDGIVDSKFITDVQVGKNGRKWYRFKIPLDGYDTKVGGIQDFRSIRFMRMYMTNFDRPTHLKFAKLDLVNNNWRKYSRSLGESKVGPLPDPSLVQFDVEGINIEEHNQRLPFNYVLPPGIKREEQPGSIYNSQQNEQSLAVSVCNLPDADAKGVYKNINYDLRVFEKLNMFIHAESEENLPPEATSLFMRIGSDFERNYYEYEVPIVLSKNTNGLTYEANPEAYKHMVWSQMDFDLELALLTKIKLERNGSGQSAGQIYEMVDPNYPQNTVKVKGNPNLGNIKGVLIGIRNNRDDGQDHCLEVWVNELRVSGLDESNSGAGLVRLDLNMADFANFSISGNYSSNGWGGLSEKLKDRQKEEVKQMDVSFSTELGKFLPAKSGIKIPAYAQYTVISKTPQYDPYDLDVNLKDKLKLVDNPTQVRDQAIDVIKTKSLNFSNVHKERSAKNKDKKPMPWDLENWSGTYAYTQTEKHDPVIELDVMKQHNAILDYSYSTKPYSIKPFKKIKKDKYLKFIKEFNFNPIPGSFTFSNVGNRRFGKVKYRFTGDDEFYSTAFEKSLTWDRSYGLNWNLAKSLKFNYNSSIRTVIDEHDEFYYDENLDTYGQRVDQGIIDDYLSENLKNLGRPKDFNQGFSLNYDLPFKTLPFLDFINASVGYSADYSWISGSKLTKETLGNVIQNGQKRSIRGDLKFSTLYKKSKYLKKIESNSRKKKRKSRFSKPEKEKAKDGKDSKDKKGRTKRKKERNISKGEKNLVRALLMVRKASFDYSENFSTVVPGYMNDVEFFGLDNGFSAPGFKFVGGWQPTPKWLDENQKWISTDIYHNQPFVQQYTQSMSFNLAVEPIKGFNIKIDARRNYSRNNSELFKVPGDDGIFEHRAVKETGTLDISYLSLKTFFRDDTIGIKNLLHDFEDNRVIISQRLGRGTHSKDAQFGNYTDGYGRYQNEVLIPAFLATYTGENPDTYDLSFSGLFNKIPLPNWTINYDGLSKLKVFEDVLKTLTFSHGYQSNLTVGSFNSDLDYFNLPGSRENTTTNFYSRYEIPNIVIGERFSPLIGMRLSLKNDMSFNFSYDKARTLSMNFTNQQLTEDHSTSITFGFGYRQKDVVIPFLQFGSKKKKGRRKKGKSDLEEKVGDFIDLGSNDEDKGGELNWKFDFSLDDNISYIHLLDQEVSTPTRGQLTIRVEPSIDYDVNKRVNLKAYTSYSKTQPWTSLAIPITTIEGGVVVRFSLN